jgi:hypothetical protein
MTSGALTREGWFGGFHVVLIGYREFLALRRMMLEMVLGVGALRILVILGRHSFPCGRLR